MARLKWPGWLVTYWDGLPIPVLTRPTYSNTFIDTNTLLLWKLHTTFPSFDFFGTYEPSGRRSKNRLAFGALSSICRGGTSSTSTIFSIWSNCTPHTQQRLISYQHVVRKTDHENLSKTQKHMPSVFWHCWLVSGKASDLQKYQQFPWHCYVRKMMK